MVSLLGTCSIHIIYPDLKVEAIDRVTPYWVYHLKTRIKKCLSSERRKGILKDLLKKLFFHCLQYRLLVLNDCDKCLLILQN